MAIFGTNGNDNLPGTAGADLFIGSGGNDFLDGRGGNDTVSYANWSGPVTVTLGMNGANGSANKYIVQWIFGQPYTWYNSTDTLRSIENVVGSRFSDTITGNELDNVLTGLGGGDTLNGGDGIDTVDYSASDAGVTANLSASFGQGGHAEGDSYQSIENVIGSTRRDTLIGSSVANKLEGKGDDDFFNGLGGGDTLDGGDGNDTAAYTFSPTGVIVNLTTNQTAAAPAHASGDILISIENVTGSAYFDVLTGNGEANTLRGEGSGDWLAGLGGADYLDGGEGEDLADYRASGAGVVVNLNGNVGLGGDAAGDTYNSIENVNGSEYDDTLTGDMGDNRLEGMGGADTLAGLFGADRLYGGEGIDTADYSLSTGGSLFTGVTVNLSTGAAQRRPRRGRQLHLDRERDRVVADRCAHRQRRGQRARRTRARRYARGARRRRHAHRRRRHHLRYRRLQRLARGGDRQPRDQREHVRPRGGRQAVRHRVGLRHEVRRQDHRRWRTTIC